MSKSYVEANDDAFVGQLRNFYLKLDKYKTDLGFSEEEVAEAKGDYLMWKYIVESDNAVEKSAHDFKESKNLFRYGNGNEQNNALPTLPNIDTPPVTVAVNIQLRFTQKAAKAKASSKYTSGIGKDLGIEVVQQTFDPSAGKPNLSVHLDAGYPVLEYKKGKFGGISIYKDTGSGYVPLTKVFFNHYTDKSALPAQGTSQMWKYKAIYMYHDEEVGSYSDEVSIAVVGHQ